MRIPSPPLHIHLKAWRKSRSLTQEQIANILGVKNNTISGWESGNRTVDLESLRKLADAYGVEPAALLYAPEDRQKARTISEAGEMLSAMGPEQREAWLRMGRLLAEGAKE